MTLPPAVYLALIGKVVLVVAVATVLGLGLGEAVTRALRHARRRRTA